MSRGSPAVDKVMQVLPWLKLFWCEKSTKTTRRWWDFSAWGHSVRHEFEKKTSVERTGPETKTQGPRASVLPGWKKWSPERENSRWGGHQEEKRTLCVTDRITRPCMITILIEEFFVPAPDLCFFLKRHSHALFCPPFFPITSWENCIASLLVKKQFLSISLNLSTDVIYCSFSLRMEKNLHQLYIRTVCHHHTYLYRCANYIVLLRMSGTVNSWLNDCPIINHSHLTVFSRLLFLQHSTRWTIFSMER